MSGGGFSHAGKAPSQFFLGRFAVSAPPEGVLWRKNKDKQGGWLLGAIPCQLSPHPPSCPNLPDLSPVGAEAQSQMAAVCPGRGRSQPWEAMCDQGSAGGFTGALLPGLSIWQPCKPRRCPGTATPACPQRRWLWGPCAPWPDTPHLQTTRDTG